MTVDPAQMSGVPCIRGLRVTVSMLLGQLAAGRTPDELLADYPYLEREDIAASLGYAAAVVNDRVRQGLTVAETPARFLQASSDMGVAALPMDDIADLLDALDGPEAR